MASFEAKISWGRPRKRENKKRKKSFRRFRTRPVIENSKKKSKKIQKIKNQHFGDFSSQNKLGMAEKERKKKSFQGVPTRPVIENSKKIENTIMASFRAKICWGRPRKRENKN